MTGTRPVVFVSSTIYDFRDLRSALKYWLESLGYDVLLSEFNDFTKPLDENSYNACLQSVKRADYFILLVGARVGGLIDKTQKLSITRMEYRTAYDLVKAKKMKLVTFVRQEIWNVREDRNALKDILSNDYKERYELDDTDINKLTHHESNLINDAEITFDFIKEISRAEEMKQAITGKGDFPVGNWIHQFSTFKDIIDVLKVEFTISERLSKVALSTNLKQELNYNLLLLREEKQDGRSTPITYYGSVVKDYFKGSYQDISNVPRADFVQFVIFYLDTVTHRAFKLSAKFIEQALFSGEFLEYDRNLNAYKPGIIHNGLFRLKEQIDRVKELEEDYRKRRKDFGEKYGPYMKSGDSISVANWDLMTPFAIYNCHQNIIRLSIALLKAIDGNLQSLSDVKILAPNPIETGVHFDPTKPVNVDEFAYWLQYVDQ